MKNIGMETLNYQLLRLKNRTKFCPIVARKTVKLKKVWSSLRIRRTVRQKNVSVA